MCAAHPNCQPARLVQVPHEVHEVLEGVRAVIERRLRMLDEGLGALDGADHAVTSCFHNTVACIVITGGIKWNVDVMPTVGFRMGHAILVSE